MIWGVRGHEKCPRCPIYLPNSIINGLRTPIEHTRLKELAWRLVYFEHPELLPSDEVNELPKWHAVRVLTEDGSVPWTTLSEATKELDTLMADKMHGVDKLLEDLKVYYSTLGETLQ